MSEHISYFGVVVVVVVVAIIVVHGGGFGMIGASRLCWLGSGLLSYLGFDWL